MMTAFESPSRIEPCELTALSPELAGSIVELVRHATALGHRLHPDTARSAADLVALMNSYYSNLIEGHHTRPRDIERALANDLDGERRRDLQLEARAHIRVQREVETMFATGQLPEPASRAFIQQLHRSFYVDAPESLLTVTGSDGSSFSMTPGEFRRTGQQDVAVGRHLPPASDRVEAFMEHFERRFRLGSMTAASQIVATAVAHHRFNFIHPFPDGNGRVSRLMSHAMALHAGIGAHGLWSISRGLARGLSSRAEYKQMMDAADAPRASDTDGRGNLSAKALADFVAWFVEVARDQVVFMAALFEFDRLRARLREYVVGPLGLGAEAAAIVDEVFVRGAVPRGEATRITKRPERTARSILSKLVGARMLQSETPKGDVTLRFSSDSADFLFPRLFPAEANE